MYFQGKKSSKTSNYHAIPSKQQQFFPIPGNNNTAPTTKLFLTRFLTKNIFYIHLALPIVFLVSTTYGSHFSWIAVNLVYSIQPPMQKVIWYRFIPVDINSITLFFFFSLPISRKQARNLSGNHTMWAHLPIQLFKHIIILRLWVPLYFPRHLIASFLPNNTSRENISMVQIPPSVMWKFPISIQTTKQAQCFSPLTQAWLCCSSQ